MSVNERKKRKEEKLLLMEWPVSSEGLMLLK